MAKVEQIILMIKIIRKNKRRNPDKKLLILDIDNTLIYLDDVYCFNATTDNKNPDFVYYYNNKEYFALKRPYLDKFLKEVNEKYDLALWTSGNKKYANDIAKILFEPLKIKLKFIFSNEECISGTIKDLDWVLEYFPEYNKQDIIAIDDSKNCYSNNPDNLIFITKFFSNKNDKELLRILKLL